MNDGVRLVPTTSESALAIELYGHHVGWLKQHDDGWHGYLLDGVDLGHAWLQRSAVSLVINRYRALQRD